MKTRWHNFIHIFIFKRLFCSIKACNFSRVALAIKSKVFSRVLHIQLGIHFGIDRWIVGRVRASRQSYSSWFRWCDVIPIWARASLQNSFLGSRDVWCCILSCLAVQSFEFDFSKLVLVTSKEECLQRCSSSYRNDVTPPKSAGVGVTWCAHKTGKRSFIG